MPSVTSPPASDNIRSAADAGGLLDTMIFIDTMMYNELHRKMG